MLLPLLLLNVLDHAGTPPSWTGVGSMAGTAISSTGVMGTTFLNDATAVPAGAFFLGGIAHASDGRRYVCNWPVSNAVHYRGAVACRSDGAMVIVGSGTIADRPHGWAMTFRGEVISSVSAPELVKDGYGQLSAGNVCLENIS